MNRLQLGFINYMNTKPFLWGLQKTKIVDSLDLHEGNPAHTFEKLKNQQINVGIIPVGALLTLPQYYINTNYCIATDGEVASVCIFAHQPIEQIDTIFLDYQSRSSVLLAKIIGKFLWKKNFVFLPTQGDGYFHQLAPHEAAVIIGDRALQARLQFEYIYDLGVLWKTLTSLPFVFALWGSQTPLNSDWENKLNTAFEYGIKHIDEVIKNTPFLDYPMDIYFKKNIQYLLDDDKRKAIDLYKKYIAQL